MDRVEKILAGILVTFVTVLGAWIASTQFDTSVQLGGIAAIQSQTVQRLNKLDGDFDAHKDYHMRLHTHNLHDPDVEDVLEHDDAEESGE